MKITRFFIVGASNTLLAYVFYVAMVKLGVDYKLALLIGYVFGIFFGYFLNRYWTFSNNKHKHRRSFMKYVLLYVGVFILNSLFLIMSVDLLLLDPIFSQFFIIGIISLVSFVFQNTWVFGTQEETKPIN